MTERLEIFRSIIAPLERVPMVDLGAGHCRFALLAHDLGFPVTAIDAREERVPAYLPFPFVKQDVRNADLSPYGIVGIIGLLYHLTLDDQIELLNKCRDKTVIVDTHCTHRAELKLDVYEGLDWIELESPRSSVGNVVSFWHTEPSLIRLFSNAGFLVKKILPEHAPNRAFWLLT